MLRVEQAFETILSAVPLAPSVRVPLARANGRILREDLRADRDFPPFDRVTMDGVAIRWADFAAGQRVFPIRGVAAAGYERAVLQEKGTCLEVMTGVMLPKGADTVLRYEDLNIENGQANVQTETGTRRQNVHTKASDRRKTDLLVAAGRRISAAEIGSAATIGKTRLLVSQWPRVTIVATGDELVPVSQRPKPHQIRMSNVFSVQALLENLGVPSRIVHFRDDEAVLRAGLAKILSENELVVLSGAVSAGRFDFVPGVLAELGVQKIFHTVSQRPGKPFWFGRSQRVLETESDTFLQETAVFALPGNPVSTFLCTCRYLLPWLRAHLCMEAEREAQAVLLENLNFKPDLTWFVPVKIQNRAGRLFAWPLVGNGSGDLANLNDADGFLELPRGQDVYTAGEAFRFWGFRP